MKRRSVLIRTVVGAGSAVVYGATGWLMGARTLTMPGNGQWGGWTQVEQCVSPQTCGCFSTVRSYCDFWGSCPPTQTCYRWDVEDQHCCTGDVMTANLCRFRFRNFACGSCTGIAGYAGGTCT